MKLFESSFLGAVDDKRDFLGNLIWFTVKR